MLDWTEFDAVFQQNTEFAYEAKQVEQIRKRRKEFDGKLFFDRILQSIGVKNVGKIYPPSSNQELRQLFNRIVKTGAADHQKHALIYYVLKDCSRSLSDADQQFVRQIYLPSKYQIFITGLWELDRGHLANAVDCLTDPSLTPTFTDEILYTLIKNEQSSDGLAMSYYITVSPPLANETILKAYFELLAKASVTDAYTFAQKRSTDEHRDLFESLVVVVHEIGSGDERASRALELVALPLSPDEEAWFEECLLQGRGAQCQNAKDSVLMRRVATGKKYESVGALDRLRGPKIDGINWDDLRMSLQQTKS